MKPLSIDEAAPAPTPGAAPLPPTCFLNADGVVHPVGTSYFHGDLAGPARPPFCWVAGLEDLARRWDLRFVLWTSATAALGFERVRALAPPWLQARIDGETPPKLRFISLSEVRKLRSSFASLSYHLTLHPSSNWVAVSDDLDGWPAETELRKRLVVCDGSQGLSDPAVVERMEAVLRMGPG
ncbi:HAD domain-containing protein [Roseateles noduli]|uniref:HAD domain-containing protein n=1 Tax=Roseateles noduli TaxID=2052484 RepID=UPI003D658563